MAQPIDYTPLDPFAAGLSGLKFGMGLAEVEQRQMLQEQQKRAQEQYQQAFSRIQSPNATATDYENLILLSGKDQAENIRKVLEGRDARQNQNTLKQIGGVAFALKTGSPEQASMLLMRQAEAAQNSGDANEAQYLRQMAELAKTQPDNVGNLFASQMTFIPGGKDALDNLLKLTKEKRAEAEAPSDLLKKIADADKAVADATTAQKTAENAPEKAAADAALATAQANKARVDAQYAERQQLAILEKSNWDVNNLKSQISDRSARLNLDKQTTQATVAEKLSSIQQRLTDIPEGARKLINESATQSATSKQAATQYNDLASRIEAAEGGKGRLTSATEWFATQFGRQDAWTQIRNEYTRVRNSVAIKALPPGVATDKDIELALKGIPPETANAATLASFLRGTAKLQDIDALINNAKTDWLSQNNGLLTRAKGTFIAGDYAAKPGETFNDFAQRIVVDVSAKYRPAAQVAEDRRRQLIEQIPTNQPPAVAPVLSNIEAQADAIIRGGK